MAHRTVAPPGASHYLTDEERADLSKKVKDVNHRSEQGRGGGQ
ncbi:hypothetical protein ACFW91_39885 [Streptomyces asoensis]